MYILFSRLSIVRLRCVIIIRVHVESYNANKHNDNNELSHTLTVVVIHCGFVCRERAS